MKLKKKFGISFSIVISLIAVISIITIITINRKNSSNSKKINIILSVFDKEGSEIYNNSIKTDDEKVLIDVLKDEKELNIETEDSKYGAYITSINGVKQGDNYYWSYYINGDYATSGVSTCKVENEKDYVFKLEKMEY